MEGVIYKYTNKINGKVYIGQTIDEVKRKSRHKSCVDKNYFHNAIQKYGWENFDYVVLERVDLEQDDLFNELDRLECKYINEYKSNDKSCGYNLTDGGHSGRSWNDDAKEALSIKFKGQHFSPETEFKTGYKMSESTRQKRSESLKGKKRTLGKSPWNKGKKTGIVTRGTTGMTWKLIDGKRIYNKN